MLFFISFSQEKKFDDLDVLIKIEGDSVVGKSIKLNEVTVYPKLKFENLEDKIIYYNIQKKH